MRIRIIDHSGNPSIDHPGFGPWHAFEEQLVSQGHIIVKDSLTAQADINIVNCYSNKVLKKVKTFGLAEHNVLIIWEPEVTNSKLYKKNYLENFSIVYCPSNLWAKRIKAKSFNWPAVTSINKFVEPSLWLSRNNKGVMILSNKFSSHKDELYSLRRKLATKADESTLSVFGERWRSSFLSNLLKWNKSVLRSGLRNLVFASLLPVKAKKWNKFAEVLDKDDSLREFRISVVIENSKDYVSEKIFDSLYAQNIVIYVGPDLRDFRLSQDLVISVSNDLELLNEMIKKIMKLDDGNQLEILERQQKVYREECSNWNNDFVMKQLAIQIMNDLKLL